MSNELAQLSLFEAQQEAKPFLKWAGGKKQLLPNIRSYYPFNHNITKYCEPFIGGGAVLFDILNHYELEQVLINDINTELINAYSVIKSDVDELIEQLSIIESIYIPLDSAKRKEFYLQQRENYNQMEIKNKTRIQKSALTIFLNRTCFNGLYRVNSNGHFNVPMGKYKNPLICDYENLINVSHKLQNVEMTNQPYNKIKSFVDEKTFVYLDPPYRPLTTTSSFKSYSKFDFSDKDQIELAYFFQELNSTGAKLLLSNSDPKNINEEDEFFDDLYKDFNIERVYASRIINSNKEKRGKISELLISNF